MSHRIVWRFDEDTVCSEIVCDEPGPARCRLDCEHGCEEWSEPYEVEGNWLHDIENYRGDVIATHIMRDTGRCGFKDWFEDAADSGSGQFVIGEHAIKTTWHGDHYTWARIEVQP